MDKKHFKLVYDAMSVGWHLRRIAEETKKPMSQEQWKRFIGWMERHTLKLSVDNKKR